MIQNPQTTLRPFRPGMAVKNGKLYLFTDSGVCVVKVWPRPQAWERDELQPAWHACRPYINLRDFSASGCRELRRQPGCSEYTLPEDDGQLTFDFGEDVLLDPRLNWAYRMEEQCRRFLEKIPRELRRIIRLFPERHFDLLCLLARCGPAAAELLGETNPALGFALALPRSFMRPAVQRPWRSVRALLRRRQRDIAARLGFAPSEAGRRLLLKIPHESTRLANLKALLRAMDDPFWLKALQHAKRLNTGALLIAGNAQLRRYASARFVQQLGNDVYQDRESYAVRQLRDVIEMRHLLPERRGAFCVHSLGELAALHEEYVATINGHGGTSALAERTYPPPPLPDEGHTITAVKNTGELRELAQACSNCALTRNKRISEYYYVYRVEYKGELATLALSGEKGGIYRVEEMAGRRNARCSPALRSEVCHWIQKHQPASMKVAAAPISANSDRSM